MSFDSVAKLLADPDVSETIKAAVRKAQRPTSYTVTLAPGTVMVLRAVVAKCNGRHWGDLYYVLQSINLPHVHLSVPSVIDTTYLDTAITESLR